MHSTHWRHSRRGIVCPRPQLCPMADDLHQPKHAAPINADALSPSTWPPPPPRRRRAVPLDSRPSYATTEARYATTVPPVVTR